MQVNVNTMLYTQQVSSCDTRRAIRSVFATVLDAGSHWLDRPNEPHATKCGNADHSGDARHLVEVLPRKLVAHHAAFLTYCADTR